MKSIPKWIPGNIIFLIIFLELAGFTYFSITKTPVRDFEQYPTYIDFKWEDDSAYYDIVHHESTHFIDSGAYPWATWHTPNTTFKHASNCYNVTMIFNSLGARGSIPDSTNSNTALMLGDSFAEGFGIEEDSTIAERYGRSTGMQTLNLGTSGHIGSTQMQLIYDHFGSIFRHTKVYVLLYLANDFTENDIRNNDILAHGHRYRPYRDTQDISRIIYKGSPDSTIASRKNLRELEKENAYRMGLKTFLKKDMSLPEKIIRLTYTARLLKLLKLRFVNHRKTAALEGSSPAELEFDSTAFRILEYDMEQIMHIADRNNATVCFINLPSQQLLTKSASQINTLKKYKSLELTLEKIAARGNHRYISFFDHLIRSKTDVNSIFFACDHHFNDLGYALLNDLLRKHG
jgi:hypothetical protein